MLPRLLALLLVLGHLRTDSAQPRLALLLQPPLRPLVVALVLISLLPLVLLLVP
jgi:hypothetical protein